MSCWRHVRTNLKFAIENIDMSGDKTHILEFGTGSGRSITYINDLITKGSFDTRWKNMKLGNGYPEDKEIITIETDIQKSLFEVIGFDSHIGLPEDWWTPKNKKSEMNRSTKGTMVSPKQHMGLSKKVKNRCLEVYKEENITFFEGFFEDTIPRYKKIAKDIALLHIDCDIYSSTIEVFYNLNEFIVPGTIIVFDEWFYNYDEKYDDHEQKAFYEWVKDMDREFEFLDCKGMGKGFVEQKTVRIIK